MAGRHIGLVRCLKQSIFSWFLGSAWRIASNWQLVSNAVENAGAIYLFKSFIDEIPTVNSRSPKLLRPLDDTTISVRETVLLMGRMLSTRWVAYYRATKAIMNNFGCLCEQFCCWETAKFQNQKRRVCHDGIDLFEGVCGKSQAGEWNSERDIDVVSVVAERCHNNWWSTGSHAVGRWSSVAPQGEHTGIVLPDWWFDHIRATDKRWATDLFQRHTASRQ